jgi:nitrogen fixation protein NifU and related proteins
MLQRASPSSRYNSLVFAPRLLDHFQNPRNPGELTDPDAAVQLENPVCGDVLKLTLRLEGGRITGIRFLAKGCVPVMACASAITELVQGKTVKEAREVSREHLVQAVGSLPEASAHASQLAMDALRAALDAIKIQPRIYRA